MDDELLSIPSNVIPRLQPLRVDAMFSRAEEWKSENHLHSAPPRPLSPARKYPVYPLPLPLGQRDQGVSPLSGLFDYPELLPHVLEHFDKPTELAVLAKVSRAFYAIVRKPLYRHIWVRPCESTSLPRTTAERPGEDGCHLKVRI
jgi:hypothetical protein